MHDESQQMKSLMGKKKLHRVNETLQRVSLKLKGANCKVNEELVRELIQQRRFNLKKKIVDLFVWQKAKPGVILEIVDHWP